MQKLLLIFPPMGTSKAIMKMCCTPLGVAYLAAYVRDDIEVEILDCIVEGYDTDVEIDEHFIQYGLTYDQIADRIEYLRPDMVGISCIFSAQYKAVRGICKVVKKLDPSIVTVAGGAHPSLLPEASMQSTPGLDYIVLSEGEETLRDLIYTLRRSKGDVKEIDGLAYRDNGDIKVNPKTRFIKDLDVLPFPARDLLPIDRYFDINLPMQLTNKSKRNLSISTSRGCAFRCAFCSSKTFWGNQYRARSAKSVLAEIDDLVARYGVRELKFEDDNLTFDHQRAKEIFEGMIEREYNLYWNTPNGTSVWTLSDELLGLMKRSGCYEVTVAFESGNQEVMNNIVKKPLSLDTALDRVKAIKKVGLNTVGYFIIGYPGETKAQMKDSFDFARKLGLDKIYPFAYNPLPGTELYDICIEKGYIPKDFDMEMENFARPSIETEEFKPEEVMKLAHDGAVKHHAKLLFRSPRKFFHKIWDFIYRKPDKIKWVLKATFQKWA